MISALFLSYKVIGKLIEFHRQSRQTQVYANNGMNKDNFQFFIFFFFFSEKEACHQCEYHEKIVESLK